MQGVEASAEQVEALFETLDGSVDSDGGCTLYCTVLTTSSLSQESANLGRLVHQTVMQCHCHIVSLSQFEYRCRNLRTKSDKTQCARA